jgi:hypothetical protein
VAAWLQGGLVTSLRVAPAVASTLLESGRLRLFAHLLSRVRLVHLAYTACADTRRYIRQHGL